MIKSFFNALNQPLGRVGVLIVFLALLSARYGALLRRKRPRNSRLIFRIISMLGF